MSETIEQKPIDVPNLTIQNLKISEIKPYDNNPRKNAKGVEAVKKSMKEFGVLAPILLDKENFIIYGHTRWQAAIELGIQEYPCMVAANLSPEKARAYRIADNAVADFSDWDPVRLMLELDGLKLEKFDFLPLTDMGLDKWLPVDILPPIQKEVTFTATEGQGATTEEQPFSHKCPRCGYAYNQPDA